MQPAQLPDLNINDLRGFTSLKSSGAWREGFLVGAVYEMIGEVLLCNDGQENAGPRRETRRSDTATTTLPSSRGRRVGYRIT